MRRIIGGHRVGQGAYWNLTDGNLIAVNGEGVLPGDHRSVYFRIPFALLFPLGLLLGGLYVAVLPVVAAGAAAAVLGRRLFGDVFSQARRGVTFGWRPTEAYLAGKCRKNGRKKAEETEQDGKGE